MEKNTFDLYRIKDNSLCDVDELKAAFVGDRVWYNCNCLDYSAIITTLEEDEEFAVINYYCGDGWMCDDYLVDVNDARNKEWVKSKLFSVVEDNFSNDGGENFDEYKNDWKAIVRIHKCYTGIDEYTGKECADIAEVEEFEVELD